MNDQHSFKNIACSHRLQDNSPEDDQCTPTKTLSCNPQLHQPQNQPRTSTRRHRKQSPPIPLIPCKATNITNP